MLKHGWILGFQPFNIYKINTKQTPRTLFGPNIGYLSNVFYKFKGIVGVNSSTLLEKIRGSEQFPLTFSL